MIRLTARVGSHSLLLVLAASVAAQHAQAPALAERITAAVQGEDWQQALRGVTAAGVSLEQRVDAVASLHGRLQDHLWARAMTLMDQQDQALVELWNEQPERRGARAAVFAEALGHLTGRYVAAKLSERQDLCGVARFQRPERWAEQWSPDWQERRRAENALQRARAAADGEAAAEVLQLLRELEPYGAGGRLFAGYYDRHGPFSLRQALVDPAPRTARRAAIALRLMLQLEVPERLAAGGRDDLELVQAAQSRVRFGGDVEGAFDKLLADLAADREFLGWGPASLDAAQRRRLAKALISYALRVPAPPWDEMSAERPGIRARDVADQRACIALQCAASLGDDEQAAAMALAAASPDGHVALRVLMAFGMWSRAGYEFEPPLAPALAKRLAPILQVMLDHPDPLVVARAAAVCGRVVPAAPDSPLAEIVVARALAALNGGEALLTELRWRGGFCGTEDAPTVGVPANPASWYVFAAAAAGDARLLAPLCAELKKFVDANGRWQVPPDDGKRHELLMLSLVQLARHLDASGARQVHELLTPAFEPAPPARPMNSRSMAQPLTRSALAAVLPNVPAELLDWYAALPREERHGAPWATQGLERLDEARASLLIGRSDADRDAALAHARPLCLRAPQRMSDAWSALAHRHAVVEAVRELGWQHGAELAALARAGRLPRALVAGSLAASGAALAELAELLPEDAEDLALRDQWQSSFAMAIERAPVAAVADDLAALRRLVGSPAVTVAFAALRRAAALGPDGRALVAATLAAEAEATGDVEVLTRVVELGVQLGIAPDNLDALMPRLDGGANWHARMVADAAAMRFAGLDPKRCASGYTGSAIQLAGIDVDEETLRAVLGDSSDRQPLDFTVDPLLRASPATIVATLAVLGEESDWSGGLQRAVAECTKHDDANVRLAAYRALSTRDAEVWPCALLAHEAVFDPDPAVRRFGESLRR